MNPLAYIENDIIWMTTQCGIKNNWRAHCKDNGDRKILMERKPKYTEFVRGIYMKKLIRNIKRSVIFLEFDLLQVHFQVSTVHHYYPATFIKQLMHSIITVADFKMPPNTDHAHKHNWNITRFFNQVQVITPWRWILCDLKHAGVYFNVCLLDFHIT